MKQRIFAVVAILGILGGVMALRPSFAQPMHDMPGAGGEMGAHSGHHRDGASDGAFHRRFDDAEKWTKEFDKPERDGWQKPEEVIDALHLDRAANVADVGAGTESVTTS